MHRTSCRFLNSTLKLQGTAGEHGGDPNVTIRLLDKAESDVGIAQQPNPTADYLAKLDEFENSPETAARALDAENSPEFDEQAAWDQVLNPTADQILATQQV